MAEIEVKNKSNKKKIIFVLIIFLAIICFVSILVVVMGNKKDDSVWLSKIEAAYKYMDELDYDLAIVSFKEAIEINPKAAEAYLGMADAYTILAENAYETGMYDEAIGFYNEAINVLNDGIENVPSDEMSEKLESIKDLLEKMQNSDGESGLNADVVVDEDSIELIGTVWLEELIEGISLEGKSWREFNSVEAFEDLYSWNEKSDEAWRYQEDGYDVGLFWDGPQINILNKSGDFYYYMLCMSCFGSDDYLFYCSSRYNPNASSSTHCTGLFEYMQRYNLNDAEDLLNHLGIDCDSTGYYSSEYGVFYFEKDLNYAGGKKIGYIMFFGDYPAAPLIEISTEEVDGVLQTDITLLDMQDVTIIE